MAPDEKAESERAENIAAAYDLALGILAIGRPLYVPTRDARRVMIQAMLAEKRLGEVDRDHLARIAIAAVRKSEDEPARLPSRARSRVIMVPHMP